VEFGIAVGAEDMARLSIVHYGSCLLMPRITPDYAKYELGKSPLFEQFIRMGAEVADDPGCISSTDPLLLQLDKYEAEDYPWNHRR